MTNENALPYLQDATHFLFSLILSVGAAFAVLTVKNFDRTAIGLEKNGVHTAQRLIAVSHIYRAYRQHAFQVKFIAMCAVLGAASSALFLYPYLSTSYVFWWGNRAHGIAGLVHCVVAGIIVFAMVWGSIMLLWGLLMLARIMRLPIELMPFHRDGCNGLAPLGKQISLLWLTALFGSLAIYVTLHFGYLGVEQSPVVWILATIGTLFIPVLAVAPLVASLLAVRNVQNVYLERLGLFLNDQLSGADAAVLQGDLPEANKIIGQLGRVKSLFEIYRSANVWPFNTKALAFIAVTNLIQIVLTAKSLAGLIPGKH